MEAHAAHVEHRYRSSEYGTEEKPWDPITAGTASFLANIGTIGMGLAEVQLGAIRAAKAGGKTKDTFQAASSTSPNDSASIATAATSQPGPSNQSTTSLTAQQSITEPPPSASVTSLNSQSTLSLSSSTQAGTSQSTASPSLELFRSFSAPGPASSNTSRPSINSIIDGEKAHGLATAYRGASRVVEASIMTPLDVCQAMAKGFRNAPLLYHDSTVRPQEKITDAQSGMKTAAIELGMGIFDGVTGLVTQPIKGAKEHGTIGLVKGIGKGLGGLFLKPTAGILGLPAYTIQGLQKEVRSLCAQNMQGYIVQSRLTQGEDNFAMSTEEVKREIVAKWHAMSSRSELQPFYLYKGREIAARAKERESLENKQRAPSSWLRNAKTVGIENRLEQEARIGQEHGQLRAAHSATGVWGGSQNSLVPTATSSSGGDLNTPLTEVERIEDEEFERAIKESVQETSRGNAEEDAMVEQAIRQSVTEILRRQGAVAVALGLRGPIVAEDDHAPQPEVMASLSEPPSGSVASSPHAETSLQGNDSAQPQPPQREQQQQNSGEMHSQARPLSNEEIQNILTSENMQVTDEEYQCLVEQAMRQSMMIEPHASPSGNEDDEAFNDEIKRAIEVSASEAKGKMVATISPTSSSCVDEDMDEELKKALELSKKEVSQEELLLRQVLEESAREEARKREEEEIMMELVRRQSLVEDQWRQKKGKGKGKGRLFEDEGEQEAEDDYEYDEELKRAMAESLRMTGGDVTPTNDGRHVLR